jgi:hypothetical protein
MIVLPGATEPSCGTCGQRERFGDPGHRRVDPDAARQRREADVAQLRSTLSRLIIGCLFLAFAGGCLVFAAREVLAAVSDRISGDLRGAIGPSLFAVFWLALGGPMVFSDIRNRRQLANRKRLRATGLRATGVVLESEEEELESGDTVHKLKLRVTADGGHTFEVRVREIPNRGVYAAMELAVLIDPANRRNAMVDWDAPW